MFLHSFKQQQQGLDSAKERKQQTVDESDGNSRLWKEHNEIVRRYCGRKREKLQANRTYTYSKEDQHRILSADPKNVFLRKLIKAGKIPNYNHNQLESEVIEKLRRMSQQKSSDVGKGAVDRLYCKSAAGARRPKTSAPSTSEATSASRPLRERRVTTAKSSIRDFRRNSQNLAAFHD